MSKAEIEHLLNSAINRLQELESKHLLKVRQLEERIAYLEEFVASQTLMLKDNVKYTKLVEAQLKLKKSKQEL